MIELGYAFRYGDYIYCNVDHDQDSTDIIHPCTAAYFTPDSSTGNMKRHMMKVHDLNEAEAKRIWEQSGRRISTKGSKPNTIERFLTTSTGASVFGRYSVTRDDIRKAVVELTVAHSLSFTFVESKEFRNLLRMCRETTSEKDVQMVSANTLKKDTE
ncbi:hypothetical protein BD560DRAFT_51963 [Blakeslea trispora]|nr:hypothetical protein BD560DRAFT_51963 [Blakeslea trispora]